MYLEIDGVNYQVIIERKRIKHTYLRVKEDLKIYVSASKAIKDKDITSILNKEIINIRGMINKVSTKNDKNHYFLGQPVDMVGVSNLVKPEVHNGKFYVRDINKIDEYYKKLAYDIYKERLDYWFNQFDEKIGYPILKVRKMKTRWGVCNRRNNSITINSELVKKEMKYIDYVIIHELCHLVHFDHSALFWGVVKKYAADYKVLRKELKE